MDETERGLLEWAREIAAAITSSREHAQARRQLGERRRQGIGDALDADGGEPCAVEFR